MYVDSIQWAAGKYSEADFKHSPSIVGFMKSSSFLIAEAKGGEKFVPDALLMQKERKDDGLCGPHPPTIE